MDNENKNDIDNKKGTQQNCSPNLESNNASSSSIISAVALSILSDEKFEYQDSLFSDIAAADVQSVSSMTRVMIAPPPLVRHETVETQPGAVAVQGPGSSQTITCDESLMDSTVVSVRRRSPSYDDQLWTDVLINAVLVDENQGVIESQREETDGRNRDLPYVEATLMWPRRRPWYARLCVSSSLLLATCIIVAIVLALTTNGGAMATMRSSPPPAKNTPSPTVMPALTVSPTTSALVDVAILIQLDDNPNETGWSLSCGLETVEEVLPGTYGNDSKNIAVVATKAVEPGAECVFKIVDSAGDGIVDGLFELYRGEDITDGSKLIAFGTGDFDNNTVVTFTIDDTVTALPSSAPSMEPTAIQEREGNVAPTAAPTATQSLPPSVAPTAVVSVTVVIRLDDSPGETSWSLKCGTRIVYNVPPRSYEGQANRLITVPALLIVGEECEFTIFDTKGDGLEEGYFELYAGEDILDSTTRLAGGAGDFGEKKTVPFVVVAAPEAAPTSSPAPTAPETNAIAVTLDLQLDKFPSETGWLLECDGTIQGYVPATAYVEQYQRITHTFYLEEQAHCKLRVTDTYGDGVCCSFGSGYFRLYLGHDISDESRIIVEGDTFRYVAESFFKLGTAPPSLSPIASPEPTVETSAVVSLEPELALVPITIVIKLDSQPVDIGWSLVCDGISLVKMSPGTYTEASQIVMDTVEVQEEAECVFVITDSYGEGISDDGFFQIYFADMTLISDETLLHEGQGFGFREEFEFKAHRTI